MVSIRPNAEPAVTTVAVGDIFLIDGATGVRALAASKVVLIDAVQTLTNKTLNGAGFNSGGISSSTIGNTNTVTLTDNNFTLQNQADTTKVWAFSAANIATGTTRTLSAPNASGTLVLRDDVATLTNKTLTNPIISGANQTTTGALAFAAGLLTYGDGSVTRSIVATDTVQGLTNKTYDTASNSFSINGVAVTANTGTGAVARAASPAFTTPAIDAATGTSVSLTAGAALYNATAIPAGGTAGSGLKVSSVANFGVFFGSGVPTLSAAQGSLYLRSDGSSTSTRMYINTNGSTTWTAVTTAA